MSSNDAICEKKIDVKQIEKGSFCCQNRIELNFLIYIPIDGLNLSLNNDQKRLRLSQSSRDVVFFIET